ncbi:short-chain dehydrogenase [Mycolicibacterium conceptionense]|uniref:Short-chain dehydrogenase n=2 Tax=Mycolicibacterium conceptionense TaxID=451644 RepID=A0ABX3VC04_9MYCO|nr:SDR family NAD(P)-dependent oxidoreductase [Mycolicibacterium conceptionense]ORV29008.1 short-chain dehydrogenase [Mycolicibacterium conceptionense]
MRRRRINLSGKRIVLTGASTGIGRQMALALSRQGAELVVVARREGLLNKLADEISHAGGTSPRVLAADLAEPGSAARVGAHALDALGGVDIVVNNAGANLTGPQSLIADSTFAREVFEVNLWSPLALTAALLPAMHAVGTGTIVNVTSTVQAVPLPLLGYYAASKAALAQATRSLRLELAETGIRVLEVVPGSTDTALRDIDELPWKTKPPRTLPPVSPASTARAVVRGLQRGATRVVYPAYSLVPLEIPVFGRLVATVGGRRVNTLDALELGAR